MDLAIKAPKNKTLIQVSIYFLHLYIMKYFNLLTNYFRTIVINYYLVKPIQGLNQSLFYPIGLKLGQFMQSIDKNLVLNNPNFNKFNKLIIFNKIL